jgi:hypothetical protein
MGLLNMNARRATPDATRPTNGDRGQEGKRPGDPASDCRFTGPLFACSVALLLLLLACNSNPSNYREQMIVYAVLNPGQAHQVVVVDRTYRVDEPAPESIGVAGAIVKLWREGSTDTVALPESTRTGFYRDTLPYPFVLPCSTYRLDVNWNGFHGAATITVPDTFRIISPYPGETLSASSPPAFVWRRSLCSAQYRLRLSRPQTPDSSFHLPLLTQDTFLPPLPGVFDTTGLIGIHIYALDSHLYGYLIGADMDTIGENVLADIGAQSVDSIRVLVVP